MTALPQIDPPYLRIGAVALLLAIILVASQGSVTTCLKPGQAPELYGPTDITAQTANQGLATAFNDDGTLTVFKWPHPSFYDQVKYHTTTDSAPFSGTAPNSGSFLGITIEHDGERSTHWLRSFNTTQQYINGTDAIVTRYTHADLPVDITVQDITAAHADALIRNITVHERSPVSSVRLTAFANMDPVVSKRARFPTNDWCTEGTNTDTARYHDQQDAITWEEDGTDHSTGEHRSVAVAMGFTSDSSGHQVGGDPYEPETRWPGCLSIPGVGSACLPLLPSDQPTGAYHDAQDGALSGNDQHSGHTTGALTQDLAFSDGTASSQLVLTAGDQPTSATSTLASMRERSYTAITTEKEDWIARMIGDAPLPATDDPLIRELARRSLVLLATSYDPVSGAMVASISTQGPYGADWIRDGAYFNYVLDRYLQEHDWVREHNLWYAELQQQEEGGLLDPPPGAWAMNYYADGVVAGPIPWEIDEVGYGAWTLWDHFTVTDNQTYLQQVYPSIRAAGDLLVSCRDADGLQCRAFEDDTFPRSQTILGSTTVMLGLRSAAAAAEELGHAEDHERYQQRIEELRSATDSSYTIDGSADGSQPLYRPLRDGGQQLHPEIIWPTCLLSPTDPAVQRTADRMVTDLRHSINGSHQQGLYEEKQVLALASLRSSDPVIDQAVRDGVDWLARSVATPETHVLGEVWTRDDGVVRTGMSQPHLWSHALFYLSSIAAYPPEDTTLPGCENGLPR